MSKEECFKQLEAVLEEGQGALSRENADATNSDELALLNTVASFTEYARGYLKITVLAATNEATIQACLDYFNANYINSVRGFIDSRNSGHLSNINKKLTTLYNHLNQLPTILPKMGNSSVVAMMNTASFASKKLVETYEEEQADLEGKLEALQLNTKRLTEQVAAIDTENKEQLSAHAQECEEQLAENTLKLESQLKINAQKYKTLLETNDQEYQDQKAVFQQGYNDKINEIALAYKTEANTQIQKAESINTKLNEHLEQAKNLLGLLSNTAMTGSYSNVATRERETATFWRRVSFGLLLLMAVTAGITFLQLTLNGLEWEDAVMRLVASLFLFLPAKYASTEASRHRASSIKNERLELELAALGPYMETLDKEAKDTIKMKLLEKYFGHEHAKLDHNSVELPVEKLISMLEKAVAQGKSKS